MEHSPGTVAMLVISGEAKQLPHSLWQTDELQMELCHNLNFPLNGESRHIIQNYSSALSNSLSGAISERADVYVTGRFMVEITTNQPLKCA